MPIASFGIFAALVVPFVYLQTILLQPFTYFLYERYLMTRFKCCTCCSRASFRVGAKTDTSKDLATEAQEAIDWANLQRTPLEPLEDGDPSLDYDDFTPQKTVGLIQTFFYAHFSNWVFRIRHLVALLGIVVFVATCWAAS